MWEWDNKAMMEAISLHDRVMRMHLAKFGGYEVATEGDAFVIAFQTPGKAVAYAAATQQVSHIDFLLWHNVWLRCCHLLHLCKASVIHKMNHCCSIFWLSYFLPLK